MILNKHESIRIILKDMKVFKVIRIKVFNDQSDYNNQVNQHDQLDQNA